MSLIKKYKQLFEGRLRSNDAKLINEVDANTTGEFDYDYFIEQVESLIETKEEVEYELLQTLDNLAEDEDVYGMISDNAERAANQIRRYVARPEKHLEGIIRLLEKAKRSKEFDQ